MTKSSKPNLALLIFKISIGTLIFSFILFILKRCNGEALVGSTTLGQFGDFYSGVFATIASIYAGVYLYQTYKNTKKDSDFQIINKLFDNIVHDINSLQFRIQYDKDWNELPQNEQKLYTGIDAIYNFNELLYTNPNSIINHLNSILNSFENIIFMANKVKYKYDDMKEITLKRIYYLYYSHILWSVWELEYPNAKRPNSVKGLLTKFSKQNQHDDSKYIIDKYAKLSIETINYLSDDKRKLIEKKTNELAMLEKLKR